MINIILAVDKNCGIGKNNKLPWHIVEEIKIFKEKTMNSVIIGGRKTIESLPTLTGRTIFCISRNFKTLNTNKNIAFLFMSIEDAINEAISMKKQIYIIGGGEIYKAIFNMNKYKEQIVLHISFIHSEYDCDTYFDFNLLKEFYIVKKDEYDSFTHCEMVYQKYGERQYLNLLEDLLQDGELRIGRNGEITSDFCKHLKFDLRNGFPLLTTKKMFTKGIIEELLFFIRGETDSKKLEEKGINIWKGNTSREFLDTNGFKDRKEGELGPLYGFQWRKFNSEHTLDSGVDQLQNVINEIKTNPTSRRILLTTYNPEQVHLGVLYPCHSIIIQFYVQNGFLDMFCYNRSQDTFHGTPFNISSTSLLLLIIAKLTNLTPRFVNISMGDVHIYKEHIDSVKEQLLRIPYIFPTIQLPEMNEIEDVEKLTYIDFKITDYLHYPTIKAKMIA